MIDVKIIARGGVDDINNPVVPRKKILIIEDNQDFLRTIGAVFESHNFNVIKSASGSRGFELAKSEKPDVIILDILLEDIDGFEALAIIREDPDTYLIPVVIYTNLQNEKDKNASLKLGANAYYLKVELPPEKLVEKVKELLKFRG